MTYKTIWITGASDGIGKSLALFFASKGKSLILSGRNKEKTQQVALLCEEKLRQHNRQHNKVSVRTEIFDCQDIVESDKVSKKIAHEVDVAIFCAGLSQRAVFFDLDIQTEQIINDINFISPIACAKNLVNEWKNQTHTSKKIMFVSSIAAHLAPPLRAMYAASKASLEHYCKIMRNELRKSQIKNIALCMIIPGFVNTEISKKALIENGDTWLKQDKNQEKGISCEKAARQIVQSMRTKKTKVYIGMKLELYIIVFLYNNIPRLANLILSKT